MSALTFTYKANNPQAIDCRTLTPDLLQDKSVTNIKSLPLGTQSVADVFDVSGEDTSNIIFKNTNNQLHYIGHQMKIGNITVEGDAGDYLGAAMQGGVLICKGNAGERAADLMRRGILLIEGDVGEYCASSMKAGTVGVLGSTGARLGYGMKRGTLLLAKTPTKQATWLDCGLHTLPFLNILYQSFQQFDTKFAAISQRRVQRWMGDASGMGKAEILLLQP
jgi:formylmethanofuran dehydrogenase subunit C